MNKLLPAFVACLFACYPKIELSSFDETTWRSRKADCSTGIDLAAVIFEQQEKILTNGQASVIDLLGEPDEHELYTRNEKFFHYDLSADTCSVQKRLSIRFNALDRAKEVAISLESD